MFVLQYNKYTLILFNQNYIILAIFKAQNTFYNIVNNFI